VLSARAPFEFVRHALAEQTLTDVIAKAASVRAEDPQILGILRIDASYWCRRA
jgi:hypothetical protein